MRWRRSRYEPPETATGDCSVAVGASVVGACVVSVSVSVAESSDDEAVVTAVVVAPVVLGAVCPA